MSFDGPLFDDDPRGRRLSEAFKPASASFDSSQAFRMALVATSWAEFAKRQSLAGQAMMDSEKWGFLQTQGVLLTDQPAMPDKAKSVHVPRQGSQYVGMTADLVQRFTAPSEVWKQADETMVEVLEVKTLSGFVLRSSLSKEELKEAEHKLKQTEYTQPAMLTADLAIERTLQSYGHAPGHGRRTLTWRICSPHVLGYFGHGRCAPCCCCAARRWARLRLTIRV